MKKNYLTIPLLVASLCASAQKSRDSSYKQQRISKTDIEVLFGYYNQHGNHSAITGGTGTEQLQVYSPEFTITHHPDSTQTLALNAGVDVLTSASLDNIDFIVSSASRVSARGYVNPSYSRRLKHTNTTVGINTGLSIESAYLAIPAGITIEHTNTPNTEGFTASLQCSFDDLRWGRLSNDYGHPVGLIYPEELRDTNWFSIYRRYSYTLDGSFFRVLNPRMQFALFSGAVYQHGLLSTPYHRVYFNDSRTSDRVEKLPNNRWKFPIGTQFNWFVGSRTIFRTYYRFYTDNFGITAHTLQLEVPVRINPAFTLTPLFRWYTQTAARFFAPYAQHNLSETWYTSDYDLSNFSSHKTGLSLRYTPQKKLAAHLFFNAASLRYSYYKRSDGLGAHILTLLLEFQHTRIVN